MTKKEYKKYSEFDNQLSRAKIFNDINKAFGEKKIFNIPEVQKQEQKIEDLKYIKILGLEYIFKLKNQYYQFHKEEK